MKVVKTDRNGSFWCSAVQFYDIFFLCDFKFLVRHEATISLNRSLYFGNAMFYRK